MAHSLAMLQDNNVRSKQKRAANIVAVKHISMNVQAKAFGALHGALLRRYVLCRPILTILHRLKQTCSLSTQIAHICSFDA